MSERSADLFSYSQPRRPQHFFAGEDTTPLRPENIQPQEILERIDRDLGFVESNAFVTAQTLDEYLTQLQRIQNLREWIPKLANITQQYYAEQDIADGKDLPGYRKNKTDLTITHSLEIAANLLHNGYNDTTILLAAVTHDLPEDVDGFDKADLINLIFQITADMDCAQEVAGLVDNVTKISSDNVFKMLGREPKPSQEEQFNAERLVEKTLTADERTVILKAFDFKHNLDTDNSLPEETQKRRARLGLQLYSPWLRKMGLPHLANEIEYLALKRLQPRWVEETQQRMVDVNKSAYPDLYKILSKLEEHPQLEDKITAISTELPHLYPIYQKYKGKTPDDSDLLAIPVIHAVDEDAVRTIYDYLAEQHGYSQEEINYNFDAQLRENYPVYKIITLQVAPTRKDSRIKLIITSPTQEITAADTFAPRWKLTPHQEEIAKQKRDQVPEVTETTQPKDVIEMMRKGQIEVYDNSGKKYTLPSGATLRDFAYYIGKNLGADAESAINMQNGETVSLDSLVSSNGQYEFIAPKGGRLVLPSDLATITTSKARRNITERLHEQLSGKILRPSDKLRQKLFEQKNNGNDRRDLILQEQQERIRQDAIKYGRQLISSLYKQSSDGNKRLDVHIERGLTKIIPLPTDQDIEDLLYKIGMLPISSAQDIAEQIEELDIREYPQLENLSNIVEMLIEYRKNRPTLFVTVPDAPGSLYRIAKALKESGSDIQIRSTADNSGERRIRLPQTIELIFLKAPDDISKVTDQLYMSLPPKTIIELIKEGNIIPCPKPKELKEYRARILGFE